MSHIKQATVYGKGYTEVSNEKLDNEFKNEVDHVMVEYSKDGDGNVLDKKCLAFYLKAGGKQFGTLDRDSKLEINQSVDINSISEKELTNGDNTIYRYDGIAL